jgi:hypothetical protein
MLNPHKQQLENDGVHIADIRWTVRLKDDVTDDALSFSE